MITPASLTSYTPKELRAFTVKDLTQVAKKIGVNGVHSMRKDELVRALLRTARKREKVGSGPSKSKSARASSASKSSSSSSKRASSAKAQPPTNPRVVRRIAAKHDQKQHQKNLASDSDSKNVGHAKDRLVLLVRDPYWLHACWEITRQSVERAVAAMAEHWHTARPILRLYEIDVQGTHSAAERPVRDIEIHGGVTNWYIETEDPPKGFRLDIGYLGANGKFFCLARSNTVCTPKPGSKDAIDENWSDVAANYEKIYAMSGGYDDEHGARDLRELFEERLRRPMGSPVVTQFGVGAEGLLARDGDFNFAVDAEMIIYGSTRPNAHVTLGGQPVKLRPDGTFTVRLSMPDRRQVLPVVASSADGVEQRTIVLAVERNTKVMEPYIHENDA